MGKHLHGGPRKGAGRKPTGRVKLGISVPPDVAGWLGTNGKSAAVVRLVRAEMASAPPPVPSHPEPTSCALG